MHDWLTVDAGAEKCLKEFNTLYNNADVYSIVDFLSDEDRTNILDGKKSTNSFIQKLPLAKKHFRKYISLFPLAIENLDLKGYDVVLSDSYAFAKGVLPRDNQLHICYCHTPMRFLWDMYFEYISDYKVKGLMALVLKYQLHKLRIWDITSSHNVDYFIANSKYVQKRIAKIYKRDSIVIYPPVDTEYFSLCTQKEDFYLVVSRLVPYKKVDLVVKTFAKLHDKKLVVIGDGDELESIKALATSNVEVLGYQSKDIIKSYMQRAKAFIFAGLEDFGIVMAEAQACGTPVICLDRGGSSEIVQDNITGVYFKEQTTQDLTKAIEKFETLTFDYNYISQNAQRFSKERFKDEINSFIKEKYEQTKA